MGTDPIKDFDMNDFNEAFNTFKKEIVEGKVDTAKFKEIEEKTTAIFDKQEEFNQLLVAQETASKNLVADQNETIKNMESEILRMEKGTKEGLKPDHRKTDKYKATLAYLTFGKDDSRFTKEHQETLFLDQKQILRSDDNTAGGYLVPTEISNEMIKKITEISDVRSVARVQTVNKKTLEIVKRLTIPQARYEGETEPVPQDASTYGAESITAYRLGVQVGYTYDMMMDSMFDINTEITTDVSESMAQREGNRFILGTASKQPEGIITYGETNVNAQVTESAVVAELSFDDMTQLIADLKTGYNPMYAFSRGIMVYLRKLKDQDGRPIWNPTNSGWAGAIPNTINDYPYVIFQDMYGGESDGTVASSSIPVVFADFFKGYRIIDRTGLIMIRDNITEARENIIKITFHRYNFGQVVLNEALAYLKIKA